MLSRLFGKLGLERTAGGAVAAVRRASIRIPRIGAVTSNTERIASGEKTLTGGWYAPRRDDGPRVYMRGAVELDRPEGDPGSTSTGVS